MCPEPSAETVAASPRPREAPRASFVCRCPLVFSSVVVAPFFFCAGQSRSSETNRQSSQYHHQRHQRRRPDLRVCVCVSASVLVPVCVCVCVCQARGSSVPTGQEIYRKSRRESLRAIDRDRRTPSVAMIARPTVASAVGPSRCRSFFYSTPSLVCLTDPTT